MAEVKSESAHDHDHDHTRLQSAPRVSLAQPSASVAANAAKVLDVTRHAWQANADSTTTSRTASAVGRVARAAVSRVVPRRSQRADLLAALNYWSPRPL
jgi:hypothetical protein